MHVELADTQGAQHLYDGRALALPDHRRHPLGAHNREAVHREYQTLSRLYPGEARWVETRRDTALVFARLPIDPVRTSNPTGQ